MGFMTTTSACAGPLFVNVSRPLGALAVGTVAIGRLAIGSLALKGGRDRELHIGRLQSDELMIGRIVRRDDAGGGRG
jgi:hypothetical protein